MSADVAESAVEQDVAVGRCAWAGTEPLYVTYHDEEWGVPVHDDGKLFEIEEAPTRLSTVGSICRIRTAEANGRMGHAEVITGPTKGNLIFVRSVDARFQRGDTALVVDYGHLHTAPGDTLQAMKAHAYADPLTDPGEADLSAHVDFQALAEAAAGTTYGPVAQGAFLTSLGIDSRAAALSRARPDQADSIAAALARLAGAEAMGTLFKAMALTGPGGPVPAGFAA